MNSIFRFSVAAIALSAPLSASALVIDSFDDGAFALTVAQDPSAEAATASVAATSAIGGTRDAQLSIRSGRGVVDARTLEAIAGGGSGNVLAVSDSARAFSDFSLGYSNLGGVDLSDGGLSNAVAFDYTFFQGFSRVAVQVVDSSGASATGVDFVGESGNDSIITASRENAQQNLIAFSDFNGTADFSSIDRIAIFFTSSDTALGGATDFELDQISTVQVVPEPASLALFAAGAGLMAARRRRN